MWLSGPSVCRLQQLGHTRWQLWLAGPQCAGSEALAHGHSCSTWTPPGRGQTHALLSTGTWTPPGQGSDPRPLHWQVDSYPLARGILPARGQTHVLCIGRWILLQMWGSCLLSPLSSHGAIPKSCRCRQSALVCGWLAVHTDQIYIQFSSWFP